MRNIINNQKKERDMLLAMPYITRQTKYDEQSLLSSKQIKLITGPRRSGKSTEALMLLKNRNFAYLNFDDGKLLKAWDEDLVSETLRQVYPGYEFLLLDEIQNLSGWDIWVLKLYRQGINMVITGSNDKETDFVTRKCSHVDSLIQVCYDISHERTLKREVDSIVECAGELNCQNLLIVTMNEERTIEHKGYQIMVVPIHKF